MDQVAEYLMSKRTVLLEGEITYESLKELRDRLLHLEHLDRYEPVTLDIDCGGGHTFPALHFCDFLEFRLSVPVHGVVTGLCGSSATFILLHCTKRIGFPNSHYLIHSTELGNVALKTTPASKANRQQLNDDLDRTHDQVTRMYMRKLKMSRKKVEELTLRGEQPFDSEMHAEEALEIGLIEEIVPYPS